MAFLGAAPSGQDNAFEILHTYSTKRIKLLAVAHPQNLLLVTLADGEVVQAQGPSRGLRQRQLLNICAGSDSFSKHLLPNHIAHSKRDVVGA